MNWIKEYTKWSAVIVEHYGSLDQFDNARTVRILLEGAVREEKELGAFLDATKFLANDPMVKEFQAEYHAVLNARAELRQWLTNKGLGP